MKTCGNGGIAPPFLTLALNGSDWSASHHGRFTPGERAPSTPWTGSWVGPRTGLDAVEDTQISCPCRDSNSGRPACSLELLY
jgi:hypothetical protein